MSRTKAKPGGPDGRRRGAGPGQTAAPPADLPVAKNEEYVADIVGIGHEGEGVGRVNGYTLFVQGALPGEKVRVKVMKVKKQYGYARLLDILEPSPDRVAPPCPIYRQCGGCQLQHLGYEAQLRWKRQLVVDSLERIGKLAVAEEEGKTSPSRSQAAVEAKGAELSRARVEKGEGTDFSRSETELEAEEAAPSRTQVAGEVQGRKLSQGQAGRESEEADLLLARAEKREGAELSQLRAESVEAKAPAVGGIRVLPTLGMAEPWRYRNKAQVPIGPDAEREGGLVGGFYAQGSHRIIDMDACLIQQERNDEVVAAVKRICRELGIRPYSEETHRGLLRHVVARYGFYTGDIMVVLVTNGASIPHQDELVGLIREAVPGIKSICHNINRQQTNVIFGDETRVLWGSDVIYDTIGDVRFAISARSFYQVNPVQTEVLYRTALDFAGLTGKETVIDAYCGIGTISLFLAQRAEQVYGVEIVPEAVDDARRNALLNGIRNVQFEVGAAEEVIPAWRQRGIAPDVIVVDPPRKGCDAALLETILAMRPARVVYVSCNPATLARDLRVLADGGYGVEQVQPVDMFPWTVHVECVVGICRVDS